MEKVANKNAELDLILRELKYEILKDFEKVCPTDMSFQRIKKDMHDKFDNACRQVEKTIQ